MKDPIYTGPPKNKGFYTPTQELRWLIIITPETGKQQILQQRWVTLCSDHDAEWRDVSITIEDRRGKQ